MLSSGCWTLTIPVLTSASVLAGVWTQPSRRLVSFCQLPTRLHPCAVPKALNLLGSVVLSYNFFLPVKFTLAPSSICEFDRFCPPDTLTALGTLYVQRVNMEPKLPAADAILTPESVDKPAYLIQVGQQSRGGGKIIEASHLVP